MRAGPRNQLVRFYRPTVTGQNTSGEDVVSSTLLGSAWVHVEALAGKEFTRGQQLQAEAEFKITMDHPLSGFTLRRKDTITWGTRTLDILSCEDPTQRRREVVITAKEYVS
jgi:SPP1 family predicted phage head-tail adaptor